MRNPETHRGHVTRDLGENRHAIPRGMREKMLVLAVAASAHLLVHPFHIRLAFFAHEESIEIGSGGGAIVVSIDVEIRFIVMKIVV